MTQRKGKVAKGGKAPAADEAATTTALEPGAPPIQPVFATAKPRAL